MVTKSKEKKKYFEHSPVNVNINQFADIHRNIPNQKICTVFFFFSLAVILSLFSVHFFFIMSNNILNHRKRDINCSLSQRLPITPLGSAKPLFRGKKQGKSKKEQNKPVNSFYPNFIARNSISG
jgi:hypothetical protein